VTRSRTQRLPNLARRTIPVAVPSPVQLPLALAWTHPIDRERIAPDPEPIAPVVAIARKARAAA
jgi:hypothetical protein